MISHRVLNISTIVEYLAVPIIAIDISAPTTNSSLQELILCLPCDLYARQEWSPGPNHRGGCYLGPECAGWLSYSIKEEEEEGT